MRKVTYFCLLLSLVAGAFLAGSRYNQRHAAQHNSASARKILYYIDPMHPGYKSDKPGIAPDCGMELVPVYAEGGPGDPGEDSASMSPGMVKISPEKQQVMGVRVSQVERASTSRTLRLLGRVAPDEARVYKLSAGIDGFIQEVLAPTTGSQVKKDQLLATFGAPNATSVIQTYILNVGAEERLTKAVVESSIEGQALPAANWNIQQRIQQLQNVGISLAQIDEIRRTKRMPDRIKIFAPTDGFVLARNVSPGLKFDRGAEWYRIADLRRIWILADVFENEAQFFRPGTRALAKLPNQQKTFTAVVSDVPPQFDPATRTLKLRLEADNPGLALRPDMFVDVELPVALPSGITVPVDAVLDSGLRKTVFVERASGVFEPRMVETGSRWGDRVQIVRGLEAGERVVVSGNFFVDSESRLRAAAAGIYSTAVKDPVCGMMTDQSKATAAGRKIEYRGTTYFFCSDQCRRDFEKDPAHYAAKGGSAAAAAVTSAQSKPGSGEGTATDPSCGMTVDVKEAAAAGRKSEYRGVTYYFCSDGCKRNFDNDPERYLKKSRDSARLSASSLARGSHD